MSFFINPFKRRRSVEELELGQQAVGEFTPDTPPTYDGMARADTPPLPAAAEKVVCKTESSKVLERAQYFESLIRARTEWVSHRTDLQLSVPDADGAPKGRKENCRFSLIGGLTAAEAADALAALQLDLQRAEDERRAAQAALQRRTQEVENLRSVVRQLSESRASALSARATLAENFCELRRAHDRVARVADLSRTVSKENKELARTAKSAAAEALRDAEVARKEAVAAERAEKRAAAENAVLREKVSLLERREWVEAGTTSACRRELTASRYLETY